jgi:ribosomal subunit interface protein
MKINYFTKNITLSGQIQEALEKKLKKFYHLTHGIKEIKVDLSYNAGHNKNSTIRLEVTIEGTNKNFQASARAADILEAADQVEDKMKNQLEKAKEAKEIKRKITRRLIRASKSL